MTPDSFERFLDLMLHYLCSRCKIGAEHHTPQDTTDGTGKHSHNGEILHLLGAHTPNADRILTAYGEYLKHERPLNIQAQIAHGYNNPVKFKRQPRSPVTQAVRNLLTHTHQTWLRHGLEQTQHADYQPGAVFPPPESRYDIGEQATGERRKLNRYAVDQDRPPFLYCSEHPLDTHDGVPWAFTAGYIPVSVFQQLGGTLHWSSDRDHLYAAGNIPAEHWTYILWDFGHRVKQIQLQTRARQQLLASGLPVITIHTVRKLWHVTTILQCYADSLKIVQP